MSELHIHLVKKEKKSKEWKRIFFKARCLATVKVATHALYLVSKAFKTEMSRVLSALSTFLGFVVFKCILLFISR